MSARRLLISGRVQGVFYRAWTEANARALGLTGWVRNLAGGDVEIHAQGSEEAIEALVRRCWEGPARAQVENISVENVEEEPATAFTVRGRD
jgi:acylphosphatase